MTGIFTARLIMVATIAVAMTGAIDSLWSSDEDVMAVFLLVVVLQVALLWRVRTARRQVGVRPDLAVWLQDRSAVGGEPVEHLADRCISSYRRALEGQEG